MTQPLLAPDTLWPAICARSRQAMADGALQPTRTRTEIIEDHGVSFRICIATSLARKDVRTRQDKGAPLNPFLPPEAALLVGRLSPTHLAVLNKFNVAEHHVLLLPREFEHQETLLTGADFDALQACFDGYDGLAFYNAGCLAGASQMHKHLQVLPLPLGDAGPPAPIEKLPIETLLIEAPAAATVQRLPQLPFAHAFVWLPPAVDGRIMLERYRQLLAEIGITEIELDGERRQSAPYNLLITRRWMLLVPRTRERFEGVSLNAACFAGSFLVRNTEQWQLLKDRGPMTALRAVTQP